jgi:hypothetical protein
MKTAQTNVAQNFLGAVAPSTQLALKNHFLVEGLESIFKKEIAQQLMSSLGETTEVPMGDPDTSTTINAPAKKRGRPAGSNNKNTKDKPATDKTPKAPKGKKVKKALTRQRTEDGLTASELIRRYDSKHTTDDGSLPPAANVVAHCAKQGIEIQPSLVHNVRQGVAKKAAAAEAEAKKAERAKAKIKVAKKPAASKAAKTSKKTANKTK